MQAASPFNLRQPFDLVAFMKQEERLSILKELKDELIEYKNEFELLREFDSFDESFLASEPNCKEVKFITSHDLSISTVLPLEHKGIRYNFLLRRYSFSVYFVCKHSISFQHPACIVSCRKIGREEAHLFMCYYNLALGGGGLAFPTE